MLDLYRQGRLAIMLQFYYSEKQSLNSTISAAANTQASRQTCCHVPQDLAIGTRWRRPGQGDSGTSDSESLDIG